jgi:hypothetical protein
MRPNLSRFDIKSYLRLKLIRARSIALLTWFGIRAWVKDPMAFPVDEGEHWLW